jgi:hypothetical protein
MNHDPELTLAQAAPPELPENLRGRVLTQARRALRWRKVERVWGWSLAAVVLLLLIINLGFGHVRERQMVALLGPQGIERSVGTVQQYQRRQRALAALLQPSRPNTLKEDWL